MYTVYAECVIDCPNFEAKRPVRTFDDPVEAIKMSSNLRDMLHASWVEIEEVVVIKDPNRPASSITDLEFVQAIAKLREPNGNGGYRWVMIGDLATELEINPNRLRSKWRRANKRKLVDGCNCGCRGDFYLLPAGEELLLKGE